MKKIMLTESRLKRLVSTATKRVLREMMENSDSTKPDYYKYFEITSVCRADIESIGYDSSELSDSQMEDLASRMADDYCDQLYWTSLETILQDRFGMKKKH